MATSNSKSSKKSTSTKSTSAKSATAKTNKSGKKIVQAASVAETKTASSGGGLDMGSILNVVGQLAGGNSEGSGESGGMGGLLSGVLGALGGGGKSESSGESGGMGGLLSGVLGALGGGGGNEGGEGGGGLNVSAIAEMLLPMLSGDGGLLETFKKHPTKTIEKLIGIDLPDDKIDPVVETVLGRLGHSK